MLRLISVYSIDEIAEELENLIQEDYIIKHEAEKIVRSYCISDLEKAKTSVIYEEKDDKYYLKTNYKDVIWEEFKVNENLLNSIAKRYENRYGTSITPTEITEKMDIFRRIIFDANFSVGHFMLFKKCIY
jgi:hypothetical protein